MTDAPELLPCPFCGGEAYLANVEMAGCSYVVCKGCKTQTDDGSRRRVADRWNTRADLPPAVKPLVWADDWFASPSPYQIWQNNGGSGAPDDPYVEYNNYRVFEPFLMNCVGDEYETLDEAKAAAQAHHNAYILSCLVGGE